MSTSIQQRIRVRLAYAVSDLGAAIARLGHRIDHEAPGDYTDGHHDGWELAAVTAAAIHTTRREDAVKLLTRLGFDTSQANLERIGL